MTAAKPVLWHLGISHYNEKVRWALAWKGIEHERRTAAPGAHMLVALRLTGGRRKTFPVLELDGERIGDSTAIIGVLEARWPEPPLYPDDPGERRRALDLEDYFDEELGPAVRLFAWHHLRQDRAALSQLAQANLPGAMRGFGPARAGATEFASRFAALRFGAASAEREAKARTTILNALDRLEAELGDGEHLVGDSFSVADLTAAALLYPVVLPAEGPRVPAAPASAAEFREPLRERPFWAWVERTYATYRRPVEAAAAR